MDKTERSKDDTDVEETINDGTLSLEEWLDEIEKADDFDQYAKKRQNDED